MSGATEEIIRVGGVELCVQAFGDPARPALLLLSAPGESMLRWDDAFCARLAESHHVIRYDSRDTGRSVHYPPEEPGYTFRDLVSDAANLLYTFGIERAHVVGRSVGAMLGQLLALEAPDRVASLTLISTRPVGPGPVDSDLPDHADDLMAEIMAAPQPDWHDRGSAITAMVEIDRMCAGRSRPFDAAGRRELAGRIYDRTANMASAQLNQFPLYGHDRWRERLAEIETPTLVVHGTADRFFPPGNGRALASEIPGAKLVEIEQMGHELPPRDWSTIITALRKHAVSDQASP